MDTLAEHLPIEIREEVLAKIDLPELCHLKLLNKEYRDIIESPHFLATYNHRSQKYGSPWALQLYFDADQPQIARLRMVRESDDRVILYPIHILLHEFTKGDGELTLLASCGSLVLFSYQQKEDCKLFMINIFCNQVQSIQVPPELRFDVDFSDSREFIFEMESRQLQRYSVHFVGIDGNLTPVWCSFKFENGAYGWHHTPSRHLRQQDPRPSKEGIIYKEDEESAYWVSSENNDICHTKHPLPTVYQGVSVHPMVVNPPAPCFSRVETTTGTKGWAVLMSKFYQEGIDLEQLVGLNLLRVSQNLDKYERKVYLLPHTIGPPELFEPLSTCLVQQNGEKVHISFVVGSEEDDADVLTTKHFLYNLATNEWDVQHNTLENLYMLSSKVFTTKMTVGRI